MSYPNKAAFKKVCKQLEDENYALTYTMIGEIFGAEFYELLLYSLMDSQHAARAIQGAVERLRKGE